METKKYIPTSTIKFVEKRKNPADTTTTYVKKVIPSIHENQEPEESEEMESSYRASENAMLAVLRNYENDARSHSYS